MKISRWSKQRATVTIADNGTATSTGGFSSEGGKAEAKTDGILQLLGYVWGAIRVTSGTWVAADFTFTASHTRDGTFDPVYDKDGTLVRSKMGSNTAGWFSIPVDVFMAGQYVKLVSTNTGSAATVSQTGGPIVIEIEFGS